MKKLKLISVLFISFMLVIHANAQTADEIVNKWMIAMGGHDKLKSIQTVYTENDVTIMNNPATNITWLADEKGYKSVTDFSGQKIIDCYIKDGGWSVNPLAGQATPVSMPAQQVKMGQLQLEAGGPLLDYASRGGKVELQGKDSVNGAPAYKIKLTTKDGMEVSYFISNSSFYIVREVVKMNADGQEFEISWTRSDYRKTPEGFLVPYATELTIPGITINFTVKKIEINKAFDANVFEMPKS
jgi:hypothetical protein